MIRRLKDNEKPPLPLLLLADPSKEKVSSYIRRGHCYVAEKGGQIIGVFVLLSQHEHTIELMNIAIVETEQGKGYGKLLVQAAIERGKALGFKKMEVGTGNSSINQLALYQKCGFRMTSIEQNYFLQHYDEAIYENGIRCMDMVRLSVNLVPIKK
ncbi:GNAT superfamily N-acetyltransferase [Salirhabdus euzebyi]|uniref:GNAT superfamily N-acetyltransferase n=1 Tax=Salirhabdus euzebyi TaxID=394506 RepID=A0A841Q6X7_9BACI|nr:GNAT family N-acetyltransferase [Salirhabdus euzebyi]MBB6454135.1 GNAT superfamily N-acetyltransferase [Salirhabdus euzebyi]